jgi:glycolate oxidase FAD binding subunit
MNSTLTPSNTAELAEAVRATPHVLGVGALTKPKLSAVDCTKICTTNLNGIVEYDPSEFTFTARAGTPLRDIVTALTQCGQYLPFDPMLVGSGATLGGTVASGLSGPGRFRFGGLRDFILGVQFVDGAGRVLRLGGKVVKNAAGFDLPKFFVGSLGRFGILTELTFKVFPSPSSRLTLLLEVDGPEAIVPILSKAGSSRWEVEALDILPDGKSVALRIGGPVDSLEAIAPEILNCWPGRKLTETESDELWADLSEFRWVSPVQKSNAGWEKPAIIKVALAPMNLVEFYRGLAAIPAAKAHVSAGGNVAYVGLAEAEHATALDKQLVTQKLCAVTLQGSAPLWLGARQSYEISTAVKSALDAENRFPSLDD